MGRRSGRARERELAGEKRAGSWLRRTALERQYRFLREHPVLPAAFVGIYLLTLPLALMQPAWARQFYLGAVTASFVWGLVLVNWQLSGVGYLQQAEMAEQWTVRELRELTRSGQWRLINHVLLRPWDIDHVLIGPAGVVVVETKGGASDWTERRHRPRIQEAIRQAAGNAGDVRRYVRPDIAGAPVHAVVALWPANDRFDTLTSEDATVLSGDRLHNWIRSLPDDQLDESGVEAAWSRIATHLERRDAHDLREHGAPPRTVQRILWDGAQYPLGVLAGIYLASGCFRLLSHPASLLATFGLGLLIIVIGRRASFAERISIGASGGLIGLAAAVVLATVV